MVLRVSSQLGLWSQVGGGDQGLRKASCVLGVGGGGAPVYMTFNHVWKRSEFSVQVSFNV